MSLASITVVGDKARANTAKAGFTTAVLMWNSPTSNANLKRPHAEREVQCQLGGDGWLGTGFPQRAIGGIPEVPAQKPAKAISATPLWKAGLMAAAWLWSLCS